MPLHRYPWSLPIACGLFCLLFVYLNPWDFDYFWHIKTGEWILQHHHLPAADPFSYTRFGHPWVTHEWLSQIILYLSSAWGGEPAVRGLVALVITATVMTTLATGLMLWPQPQRVVPIILLLMPRVLLAAVPRPLIFTLLCEAVLIHLLCAWKYTGRRQALYGLPVLMLLWVNLHGGFMLGLLTLGFFTLTEAVHCWQQCRLAGQSLNLQSLRAVAPLLAVSLLGVAACLINPNGWQLLIYPFYVSGEAVNAWIKEWQSPDFHLLQSQAYLLAVGLWGAVLAWGRHRPDVTELLLPGGMAVAGFISVRHVPLACLALAPFIILQMRDGMYWQKPPPQAATVGSATSRQWWLPGGICLLVVWLAWQAYPQAANRRADMDRHLYPVGAVDYIAQHQLPGPLFNPFSYGGYLIWRLYPQYRVMIDGRPDMYGDRFTLRHLAVENTGIGWRAYFQAYGVRTALVADGTSLQAMLARSGHFRKVYDDGDFSVFTGQPGLSGRR